VQWAQVAGGAAGYLLLGRIARMTNRRDQAAAHFSAALEHDPLLWQAFEELCHLGVLVSSPPLAACGSYSRTSVIFNRKDCASARVTGRRLQQPAFDSLEEHVPCSFANAITPWVMHCLQTRCAAHPCIAGKSSNNCAEWSAGAEQEARAWLGGTDDDDAHGAAGSGSAMSGWGQPGGSQGPQRVPQRYEQQQQPAHWEGWEGFRPSGAAQPQHAFQFPAPQQPTPQQPFAGGTPFTATPNGFGGAGHAPSPVNAFTFGTHMSPSPMQWGQGPGRGLPTPVRSFDLQ